MEIVSKKLPKALITGAEGFTGQYLARELSKAGYDVYGTTFVNADESINLFSLDLCNRKAVNELVQHIQPDIVAHLGAISFVAEENISRMYETNFLGSHSLLEALGKMSNKPKAILMASSANIYGNSSCEILTEAMQPQPVNDYGVSKYAMEKMAQLWLDRLPVFIVRPFNYTGVGQSENFLIPKIVSHFRAKKDVIELGNLDVWREFGDVRFVVQAYAKLLELSPMGQVFNICTGYGYSLREIMSLCEEITSHHMEIKVNPKFVRENEVRILKGDNRKLMTTIGNCSLPSLKETLTWMLNEEGTP